MTTNGITASIQPPAGTKIVETITTSGPPFVADGVLHSCDDLVAAWVCDRLGSMMPQVAYRAFGICSSDTPEGQVMDLASVYLVGGVYWFNHYSGPDEFDISAGVAVDDMTPISRRIVRKILDYPFNFLKVPRVTVHINSTNQRAIEQAKKMGFKVEGVKRNAGRGNTDTVVLGLLPGECPMLMDD